MHCKFHAGEHAWELPDSVVGIAALVSEITEGFGSDLCNEDSRGFAWLTRLAFLSVFPVDFPLVIWESGVEQRGTVKVLISSEILECWRDKDLDECVGLLIPHPSTKSSPREGCDYLLVPGSGLSRAALDDAALKLLLIVLLVRTRQQPKTGVFFQLAVGELDQFGREVVVVISADCQLREVRAKDSEVMFFPLGGVGQSVLALCLFSNVCKSALGNFLGWDVFHGGAC